MFKSASITTLWNFARALTQGFTVMLVARLLGADGYGVFGAVISIALLAACFSGFGCSYVMYAKTSITQDVFNEEFSKSLAIVSITGVAIIVVIAIFLPFLEQLLEVDILQATIICIMVAEVICVPLITASSYAFAAHQQMGWSSFQFVLLALSRLVGVCLFWTLSCEGSINAYSVYYLTATFLSLCISGGLVFWRLSFSFSRFAGGVSTVFSGIKYTGALLTGTALNGFDKVLALRTLSADLAGNYTAAYRLACLFAIPLDSFASSQMAGLFKNQRRKSGLGAEEIKFFLLVAGLGLVGGGLLFFCSDLLPLLLGSAYQEAVLVAKSMFLFIPLYGLRVMAGNILLARNAQKLKIIGELSGVLTMISVSMWLMLNYGVKGAVYMLLASEFVGCLLLWFFVVWKIRK